MWCDGSAAIEQVEGVRMFLIYIVSTTLFCIYENQSFESIHFMMKRNNNNNNNNKEKKKKNTKGIPN